MKIWTFAVALLLGVTSLAAAAEPATRSATRPARQRATTGEVGRPAPAEIGERIKEHLEKLELSAEQKEKVKEVLASARAKMQQVREETQDNVAQVREKTREVMQDTRRQLGEILDPQQRQKLRELFEGRDRRPSPTTRGAATRTASRSADDAMAMEGGAMKEGGEMMETSGGSKARGRAREKAAAPRKPATAPALAVGAAVPDLTLRKLDGLPVQLSSYKGRPIVLEFGSYSSPSFRQRAAMMEQLKKEFGARVTFLIVYTAEAHPVGGWEADRNKADKIFVGAHQSLDDRKAAANKAKESLKITIPIVLDDMDESVAKTFGARQNSLVIVRDGKVVARQEWADPHGARRLIENVVKPGAAMQNAP